MAPITPKRTLFQINGRRINPLVAPTICIVLMVKRLEYIESRIELLISNTAIIKNTANHQNPEVNALHYR